VIYQNNIEVFRLNLHHVLLAGMAIPRLITQLTWRNTPSLVTEQINFERTHGLSIFQEDMLVSRHGNHKKTLIGALSHGDLPAVIWFMRRKNYRPDNQILSENGGGCTALLIAIACGNFDLVNFLLRHGSSLKEKNRLGHTPLMFAAMHRHLFLAAYFL